MERSKKYCRWTFVNIFCPSHIRSALLSYFTVSKYWYRIRYGAGQIWFLLKFRSEKVPRNRPKTIFINPGEKVLLSRNSVCLGKALSEVRNGKEHNSVKNEVWRNHHVSERVSESFFFCLVFRNKFPVFSSSANWFGTEFQAFLSSAEWFGTKLRSSECFSLSTCSYLEHLIMSRRQVKIFQFNIKLILIWRDDFFRANMNNFTFCTEHAGEV